MISSMKAYEAEVAHIRRRSGKPVRTIDLISPQAIREAAEMARLAAMPAEGQAAAQDDGREM